MTLTQRISEMAGRGVDIATITLVLRSEGISDEGIAQAYDEVAAVSETEIVGGSYFIRT